MIFFICVKALKLQILEEGLWKINFSEYLEGVLSAIFKTLEKLGLVVPIQVYAYATDPFLKWIKTLWVHIFLT